MNKEIKKTEKKILVIGNGFDLYHCLPTRYIDFIRVINRLLQLAAEQNLSKCSYVNYILGDNSPLSDDEHIQACNEIHGKCMKKVKLEQQRLERLVAISKENIWIQYFLKMCKENIGWIDFEKEMARVINAITNYFERTLEKENIFLIKGIEIKENILSRSDIDILLHIPFFVNINENIRVKEKYYTKDIEGKNWIRIDEGKIIARLEQDLEDLAEALCIYLEQFVQSIAIDSRTDNFLFENVDEIINFNYTDTYSRLYSKDTKVFYVHGSMNKKEKGIVLGINSDEKDQLEHMDLRFVKFKKYYQRIQKEIFFNPKKILDKDSTNHLHIVGHSLDITDRDILKEIIEFENTFTTVYFHSDEAKNELVKKLILLFGKERFEELIYGGIIKFQLLQKFIVA